MSNQKCCCWPFVPHQPCGCPPGTVRSFLAIFSTIVILVGLIVLVVVLALFQQWAIAGTVANGPTAILSAIISYYFASKQTAKPIVPHSDGVEVIGGTR